MTLYETLGVNEDAKPEDIKQAYRDKSKECHPDKKGGNKSAYKLFHDGALAFADIENNGIRIDTKYYKTQKKNADQQIELLELELARSKEVKKWKELYKDKFNLNSGPQLSTLLFKHLNIEAPRYTDKGNPSVDKDTLHLIDLPFIEPLINYRKLLKLSNTYLKGIIQEINNGYLHPSFNLHIPRTYRSSSSKPNFQNLPMHDKEIAKIIRQGFIPREGSMIGGFDYSGIELSMSGCNSKDQALIDSFTTIHKTQAAKCYALKLKEVTKDIRFHGKNSFVFPEIYGSWYKICAMNLFNLIREMKLKTVDGTDLMKHLKNKKLGNIKAFTKHIEQVEDEFWEKYHIHKEWQNKWISDYYKKGYVELLTGFRCGGIISKNQLLNYSNQGPAFHCLLWSIIKMNNWLKKYKMKSMIIGQIHDDMVMDINIKESQDVFAKAKEIMCEDIKKEWKWIITPLQVEAEFSNVNWYEKKEIKI